MKQLSIFVENKKGTLVDALDAISEAGIQIISSTIADTSEYGVWRIICDKPEQAYLVLKEKGMNLQITDVTAITVEDKVGAAAEAMHKIKDLGIEIAYMYSYRENGKGVIIYKAK